MVVVAPVGRVLRVANAFLRTQKRGGREIEREIERGATRVERAGRVGMACGMA